MPGEYKPLMNHRAVREQQIGNTAAAPGLGLPGREGIPDGAENLQLSDSPGVSDGF